MQRMGLRAVYQKPRTTMTDEPSERFSCMVDLRRISKVDQIWFTDITYMPLKEGFVYLLPILDILSSVDGQRRWL